MEGIRRAAKNKLLAERRFADLRAMDDDFALKELAEWHEDHLKRFYERDEFTTEELEMILHRKFVTPLSDAAQNEPTSISPETGHL